VADCHLDEIRSSAPTIDFPAPTGRRCANLPVRADYLDQVIWDHVTALLADPTRVRAELDRRLGELQAANPTTATKARLQREQTRTATAISRLVEAYQEQLLSLAELRERMPTLRAKEQTLRGQLDALEAELVDQETYLKLAETLEGFLARLRGKADTASVPERQRVLRLLVKEVLIAPERVVIRHRIPVTNPEPTPGYLLRGRSPVAATGQRGAVGPRRGPRRWPGRPRRAAQATPPRAGQLPAHPVRGRLRGDGGWHQGARRSAGRPGRSGLGTNGPTPVGDQDAGGPP
jgi:site-specific DNA recombinase